MADIKSKKLQTIIDVVVDIDKFLANERGKLNARERRLKEYENTLNEKSKALTVRERDMKALVSKYENVEAIEQANKNLKKKQLKLRAREKEIQAKEKEAEEVMKEARSLLLRNKRAAEQLEERRKRLEEKEKNFKEEILKKMAKV